MFIVSVHMEASFRNASTGQIMTLEVRGDFLGGSAAIFIGDGVNMPIAQLSRDWSNVLRSTVRF